MGPVWQMLGEPDVPDVLPLIQTLERNNSFAT